MAKYRNIILSALALAAIFLFWQLKLPYHLHYQESTQMFQFTASHFLESFGYPGGLASLLGGFLVQFFAVGWLGALLMALCAVGLQALTWKVMKRMRPGVDDAFFPLSFIPAACSVAFMCDAGNLLSAVVALLMVCGAWLVAGGKHGVAVDIALTVLLYYLCGPMAYVFVLLAVLGSVISKGSGKFLRPLALLCTVALMLLASRWIFGQYPFRSLSLGVGYSYEALKYTASYWVMMASVPVLALLALLLPGKALKKGGWVLWALLVLVVAGGAYKYVGKHCSKELESVYAYDYMASQRDWEGILERAGNNVPRTPAEVTCLNLALVMSGQSGDHLFDYFQAGIQGLFPNYDTYMFLKMTGSEALYQAGLLNMALHYSYESLQTFPGFRGSARHLKRMAEISMITGDRDVAVRYLKMLTSTLFYSGWARKHLADAQAWKADEEYARLAQYRNFEDRIVDDMYDVPKQEVLRTQVGAVGKADASYHYLLAYDLLSKDIEAFKADLELVEHGSGLPTVYQQALLLPWMMGGGQGAPDVEGVSDELKAMAGNFMADLQARKSGSYMKARYGKTVWWYFASKN